MVKQLDIFGNEVDIEIACPPEQDKPSGRPKRATMTEMYGEFEGKFCGGCKYLLRFTYRNRTYFKCEKWVISHSESTDKRLKDMACKLYTESDGEL